MAKKKTEIDDLFAEVAEATGGTLLSQVDNCSVFIDTGSLASNYVCSGRFINGGIPKNRITEIYGPSSSGKSLLANNVLFGCQKLDGWAIILDCENASNAEWMEKASHLDTKRVIRYTPFTLEQAFLKIHNAVRTIREREVKFKKERKPIVIVYDSISVSPCEREFREADLPENYNPTMWKKIVGSQEQPGERAKIISKELRKLQGILEKEDVTVLFINQTREKIGVMYGDPETRPGGKALFFYASVVVRTQQKKKIEHAKLKTYSGVNMEFKNMKNRTFRPFVKTEGVKLFFESGVHPLSGLLSCFIEDERIVAKGAGNFEVTSKYLPEGKEVYKFKSSLERNDIPLQVLLDCPALLNAKTTEEVKSYLTPFETCLNYSDDEFVEKIISYDDEGNPIDPDLE